jgi:hypothetical protein
MSFYLRRRRRVDFGDRSMASLLDAITSRVPALASARFAAAVKREKQALDREIAGRASATPPKVVMLDEKKTVWKIAVPGREDCFMSLTSGMNDQNKHVVMVDADKFYRAWLDRASPVGHDRQDQCVLRSEMPRDRKYEDAVKGFSHGKDSPVPLADCFGVKDDAGGTRVTFANGVTRSFWLLANRAESFPVVTDSAASAQALHKVAGVGAGPVCVASLFDQARRNAIKSEPSASVKPPAPVPLGERTVTHKPRSRGSRL